MKRVIEAKNLAFNHMMNICDLCKRCKGFRQDNDDLYDCKYNTDRKGLYSGLVRNHIENFKCKYFKRNQQYQTCKLMSKKYESTCNKITRNVTYKRGKFSESVKRQ